MSSENKWDLGSVGLWFTGFNFLLALTPNVIEVIPYGLRTHDEAHSQISCTHKKYMYKGRANMGKFTAVYSFTNDGNSFGCSPTRRKVAFRTLFHTSHVVRTRGSLGGGYSKQGLNLIPPCANAGWLTAINQTNPSYRWNS